MLFFSILDSIHFFLCHTLVPCDFPLSSLSLLLQFSSPSFITIPFLVTSCWLHRKIIPILNVLPLSLILSLSLSLTHISSTCDHHPICQMTASCCWNDSLSEKFSPSSFLFLLFLLCHWMTSLMTCPKFRFTFSSHLQVDNLLRFQEIFVTNGYL